MVAIRHGAPVKGHDLALLDYDGAARYLCTTPRHVRELWAKRHLAAIEVGRSVRFRRRILTALLRLIASRLFAESRRRWWW